MLDCREIAKHRMRLYCADTLEVLKDAVDYLFSTLYDEAMKQHKVEHPCIFKVGDRVITANGKSGTITDTCLYADDECVQWFVWAELDKPYKGTKRVYVTQDALRRLDTDAW